MCYCTPGFFHTNCTAKNVTSCNTACAASQVDRGDLDSGIVQFCYSGNTPTFLIRANCDTRQSVFGFCCYPSDSSNSSELCNSEEAYEEWRRSMETPIEMPSTSTETPNTVKPSTETPSTGMETPDDGGPIRVSDCMGSNAVTIHKYVYSICILMLAAFCIVLM